MKKTALMAVVALTSLGLAGCSKPAEEAAPAETAAATEAPAADASAAAPAADASAASDAGAAATEESDGQGGGINR